MDECRTKRYTECGNGRCYKPNHCRTFFDNGMVVNQLIRRVDVYRGYQINISFNFDLTPYIEGE